MSETGTRMLEKGLRISTIDPQMRIPHNADLVPPISSNVAPNESTTPNALARGSPGEKAIVSETTSANSPNNQV
jgi:hypothetical protein